jgi:hypothetical protein
VQLYELDKQVKVKIPSHSQPILLG